MTRIPVDRVPTARELEQMYAEQVAADWHRARSAYGPRAGGPGQLAEINVSDPRSVPPRPAVAVETARTPSRPQAACSCGAIYRAKKERTAKAMVTKCQKRHTGG